jgi:hypothetical protein
LTLDKQTTFPGDAVAGPSENWFLMPEIRRRRLANAVWIPLRQAETVGVVGEKWKPGYQEEVICAGAVAFRPAQRELAERLGWSDLGLPNAEPYAFEDGRYKPADIYQYNDGEDAGIHLVVVNRLIWGIPQQWLVNQDLILALGLLQEGDVWVRPIEGYAEVMRRRRTANGEMQAIEIKAEYLRDYLAARGLALRVATNRQRVAIMEHASYLPNWREHPVNDEAEHSVFKTRVFAVDGDGSIGGSVAVMHVWRTDVDTGEDVPVMGPESDENTASEARYFERPEPEFHRVEGELWREEWIEPADRSVRIRRDEPAEQFHYAIEADGTRLPGSELNNEDVGRWLWFQPSVIKGLVDRRGGALEWYTRDTGGVACVPGYVTHFGVNGVGLVNVYAYDIAKLDAWQQRIWAGHNVSPDGLVCDELLASQARGEPADTTAPEQAFVQLRRELNELAAGWYGAPLFNVHEAEADILKSIYRFRAFDRASLLGLAKDIARLTADMIDIGALRQVQAPPNGERWGSLKQLEKSLGTIASADDARSALAPLVGIYKLRLGDAHLPTRDIEEAFQLAGIDLNASPLQQAFRMIDAAVVSFRRIAGLIAARAVCLGTYNVYRYPCKKADTRRID